MLRWFVTNGLYTLIVYGYCYLNIESVYLPLFIITLLLTLMATVSMIAVYNVPGLIDRIREKLPYNRSFFVADHLFDCIICAMFFSTGHYLLGGLYAFQLGALIYLTTLIFGATNASKADRTSP